MINYRMVPEHKLMVMCLWGTSTAGEILQVTEKLRSDTMFSAEYDAVVDSTNVEHTPTGVELRMLADPRIFMTREGAESPNQGGADGPS